jgi:hypothetical protein
MTRSHGMTTLRAMPMLTRRDPPPDAARMAAARHIRRDARTDEISWPPTSMRDVLRELKLED